MPRVRLTDYLPRRRHADYLIVNGRWVPGWRWQWVELFRRVLRR